MNRIRGRVAPVAVSCLVSTFLMGTLCASDGAPSSTTTSIPAHLHEVEYEFSELKIADLLHDKSRLGEWMHTVPDFEDYEAGSEQKVKKVPR